MVSATNYLRQEEDGELRVRPRLIHRDGRNGDNAATRSSFSFLNVGISPIAISYPATGRSHFFRLPNSLKPATNDDCPRRRKKSRDAALSPRFHDSEPVDGPTAMRAAATLNHGDEVAWGS
jgi:hypothetical protein